MTQAVLGCGLNHCGPWESHDGLRCCQRNDKDYGKTACVALILKDYRWSPASLFMTICRW